MHVNILWTARPIKKAWTVLTALDLLWHKKEEKTNFCRNPPSSCPSKGAGVWCKGRSPVNCKKCKCYNVYGNQKRRPLTLFIVYISMLICWFVLIIDRLHFYFEKLACTISVHISCISLRSPHFWQFYDDVLDIGSKSGHVGWITYGLYCYIYHKKRGKKKENWHIKLYGLFKKTQMRKKKSFTSRCFILHFYLWFSANIVTRVILVCFLFFKDNFYLNSRSSMCIFYLRW